MPSTPAVVNTRLATRERILDYLEEHHVASIRMLSRAWGLTRADIHYHFSELLKESLVELAPGDPSMPRKPGRPEQFYRLAPGTSPDIMVDLFNALFSTLLAYTSEDEMQTRFQTVADQMVQDYKPAVNLIQRLNQATGYLNQRGYRARWEAGAGGPRFLFRTCPYAAIASSSRHICILDRLILDRLTGLPFHHLNRINFNTGKPPACVFTGFPPGNG